MTAVALPGLWLPEAPRLWTPRSLLRRPLKKWLLPGTKTLDDYIVEAATLDQLLGTSNGAAQTIHSYVTAQNVASGGLIVVAAGRFNGTNTTLSASGGSLTWAAAPTTGVTNGSYRVYLFWAFASSGLPSGTTISITASAGSNDFTVAGVSYLGLDSAAVPVASATSTGAATAWGPASVANNIGNLIVGIAAGDAGASRTSVPALTNGSTPLERVDFFGATSGGSLTIADKLSAPQATDRVSGAWSANSTHGAINVAFAPAGAAPAKPNRVRRSDTAVQHASTWMRRHDRIFVPWLPTPALTGA